jgi:PAS domain S-box-containing protein
MNADDKQTDAALPMKDMSEREQLECRLRESEQRLRSILDHTYQFIGLLSPEGILLDANRTALKFSGIEASRVVGQPFWETPWWAHSPELQKWLRQAIQEAAKGKFARAEVTHCATDGSLHWIDFSLTPVTDETGKVTYLIPEGRDITEQKLAQDALRQSQKTLSQEKSFLDATLNSLPGVFYILDDKGEFVHRNSNFQNVTGRSNEELAQMSAVDCIAPEDRERTIEKIRETFVNGKAEMEANLLTKDGRKIPYLFTGARTTIGDHVYLAGMGIDITKERQIEEERRKIEKEIRDLYDNAPCGYHSLDANGLFLRINDTELAWLGYSRDEVVGKKTFRDLLTPESATKFDVMFPAFIECGKSKDIEYKMLRKDGSVLPVLLNSSAVVDASGNFRMSRSMLTDITTREQMENESRLRLLLDSTGQAIYVVDTQGICTFCNPACLRVLGYRRPEDLLGKNMHSLIHYSHADGSAFPMDECPFVQAFHQGTGLHIDDEFLWRSDGVGFHAEMWSHPQKSGDAITGAVVAFVDITERKHAEAELRKMTIAVEQSPASIIITDRQGTIEYVNPKFTQITGYTLDEMRGKTPRILRTGYTSDAEYKHLWKTILSGHEWRGEFFNRKKNGECYWDRAVIAPVNNVEGAITHFIAIEEDITAYKQAEAEIHKAEDAIKREVAKLSTMISGMEEGVAFADAGDVIIEVNDYLCRFVGRQREEVLGKRIGDIHQGAVRDNILRQIDHFRRNVGSAPFILERTFGNAEVILRMQPIYRNKKYDGVLLNIIDVTELVKARRLAEATTRAKSMFLAAVSHELRTPLNAIIGMTGMLLDTNLNAEQRDCFDTVRTSSEILLSLINEILDFSKIEAGKMELENQPFDLVRCVEEAIELIEVTASKKNLAIVRQITSELPRFFIGDIARLRQILVNLLSNSVKFTHVGQITVSVSGEPAAGELNEPNRYQLHFTVQDTGMGIAPEDHNLLFQSFSRIYSTAQARAGGTGLGLAISKRLTELMGGRIWVESSGIPGEGAAFHFTVLTNTTSVPTTVGEHIAEHLELEQIIPTSIEQKENAELHLRVLLAEDNPVNQKVAMKMLDKLNCRADTVSNGREATQAVERIPYDVILMDCQMPEMDGFEATRLIRALEQEKQLPHVRIIAMTAGAMQGDREQCLLAGMDDYLSKPVRLHELQLALRHCQPISRAENAAK